MRQKTYVVHGIERSGQEVFLGVYLDLEGAVASAHECANFGSNPILNPRFRVDCYAHPAEFPIKSWIFAKRRRAHDAWVSEIGEA